MENYTFVEHLNSINLKHYSETCPNDHICKTTNAESAQANSRQIVTFQRDQRPLFWLANEKKTCLKQQLQNFIQRRNAEKLKEQFIKNKRLSDYIYSTANKLISFFFTGNTI